MALNKFMHPRNIYRTPPDFEKLSKIHADFSKIVKLDGTGKVTIDFQDPHSLRVLTRCLLKTDFNLDVEIPEDRLVPTLPLRLNYILWIEDLMNAIKRNSNIQGIDIGTGACAVYPLLAAAKNKWYMLATETDPVSFQRAQENVQRNNLQQLIKLINKNGKKLIENLFIDKPKDTFDFCMCNPPFYSNLQELCESRSPARLPPKNAFTGSPQELITEGGELKFCRTLIEESKRCKDNVLIFTTMVGHKYNLSEMLLDLKAEGIKHTHTEFCQGRVTRWGLAWTYQDHDIYSLVPPRDKPRKKNVPVIHQLPPIPNCEYNMETAYNKIKTILNELQIQQRTLNKCGNRISVEILAKENTWSNQRRKRRLQKRMEATNTKKIKLNSNEPDNIESVENTSEKTNYMEAVDAKKVGSNSVISENVECIVNILEKTNDMEIFDVNKVGYNSTESENIESIVSTLNKTNNKKANDAIKNELNSNESDNIKSNINTSEENNGVSMLISNVGPTIDNRTNKAEMASENLLKSNVDEIDNKSSKSKHDTIDSKLQFFEDRPSNGETSKTKAADIKILADTEAIIQAFLKLYKKKETIQLEIEFVNGTGGKESVYQVVQYIKNNWK